MEDLNDVSPYLRLTPRTQSQALSALEISAAMPYRIALRSIAAFIGDNPKSATEAWVRDVAERALGIERTEEQKAEEREYREATTRDAPLDD